MDVSRIADKTASRLITCLVCQGVRWFVMHPACDYVCPRMRWCKACGFFFRLHHKSASMECNTPPLCVNNDVSSATNTISRKSLSDSWQSTTKRFTHTRWNPPLFCFHIQIEIKLTINLMRQAFHFQIGSVVEATSCPVRTLCVVEKWNSQHTRFRRVSRERVSFGHSKKHVINIFLSSWMNFST